MREPSPAVRALLARTLSVQEVIEIARNGEPFRIFDRFPLREVRAACLEVMKNSPYNATTEERVGWAEAHLSELARVDDDILEGLLSWYLFTTPEEFAVRALEFAIRLGRETLSDTLCSKLIAGRLKEKPKLYWLAPSLHKYLKAQFGSTRNMVAVGESYSDHAWHLAERAIRRILQVQDVTFLPVIRELEEAHRTGQTRPASDDGFTAVTHTAILLEALRALTAAKAEQWPDLHATVGEFLRTELGLAGKVHVFLSWGESLPKHVEADEVIMLRVRLDAQMTDVERMRRSLNPLLITCSTEGLEILHVRGHVGGIKDSRWYSVPLELDEDLTAEVHVRPEAPGHKRLWLTFEWFTPRGKGKKRVLARTAYYVDCE